MGQAIPPAKGMPRHDRDAGHHNQTSLPPRDVSADGNGRRSFALPSDAAPHVPAPAAAARIAAPIGITLETALYALILVAAVLTRFWDLGSRALHHDESLHAYFSWLLATGQGYAHDPLMHGPFLFHMNALIYALFGASDASSRFAPRSSG